MQEIKRYSKGFTFVELLVVIAIIAILSSTVLALLAKSRTSARNAVRIENTNQIAIAIELYKNDNNGVPPGVDGLEYINGNHNWIPGLAPDYIGIVPSDPINENEFRYHYMRQGNSQEVIAFMEEHGDDPTCNDNGPGGCDYYEKGSAFLAVYNPGASGWNLTATSTPPDPEPDPEPTPDPDPEPTPDPDPEPTTGWQLTPSIDGNIIAWVDQNGEGVRSLWKKDLTTGTETKIASEFAGDPDIDGNIIVWGQLASNGYVDGTVYMHNHLTGVTAPILPATPGRQNYARISGNRVVYDDSRNGKKDIYMYDISTEIETRITDNPEGNAWAHEWRPDIYGTKIVYMGGKDSQSSVRLDIFVYDIVTGIETKISSEPYRVGSNSPKIDGNKIVYQESGRNWPDGDIFMYDLSTGQETNIAYDDDVAGTGTACQHLPTISGNNIIWHEGCNHPGTITSYDLSTGVEKQYSLAGEGAHSLDMDIDGSRVVYDHVEQTIDRYWEPVETHEIKVISLSDFTLVNQ